MFVCCACVRRACVLSMCSRVVCRACVCRLCACAVRTCTAHVRAVCMDRATDLTRIWQVTINNMPMLVIGASDCFASFCPGVIALCTNETQLQYEQILRLADTKVCDLLGSFLLVSSQVTSPKDQFGEFGG